MVSFTPLIRQQLDLKKPLTGQEIFEAVKAAVQLTNTGDRFLRERRGWDDSSELIYLIVNSTDPSEKLIVKPLGDGIDFFILDETYTTLVVEYRDWSDDDPESYAIEVSDEEIFRSLKYFIEVLYDEVNN